MTPKSQMDVLGAAALTVFALHLAFNQVVIKVVAGGFGPIFAAGLRSAGAVLVLLLWMRLRGISLGIPVSARWPGVLAGSLFALEFMCLFAALDFTTVSRASVIFYSMPVWLALGGHFLIPGDRLTRLKIVGLLLAMAGVALALLDENDATGNMSGDVLALVAAMCWAGIALCVKATPLKEVPPAQQLLMQVAVSAPIMLVAAMISGDLLRELEPIHLWGMGFQIVAVASLGFLAWFWLMTIYPASAVASFSFLSPVFAVLLGWLLLGEDVTLTIWIALALVAVGITLINRPRRS
ncbi:MAG: DMT family transporter [Pseudomonadota bacterium]